MAGNRNNDIAEYLRREVTPERVLDILSGKLGSTEEEIDRFLLFCKSNPLYLEIVDDAGLPDDMKRRWKTVKMEMRLRKPVNESTRN